MEAESDLLFVRISCDKAVRETLVRAALVSEGYLESLKYRDVMIELKAQVVIVFNLEVK